MTTEPQTAAGQRLDLDWPGAFIDRLAWRQRILAIEREARSGLDAGLLRDVIDHIGGLNALLAAYRVGSGRSPEKALATLDRTDDVPSRLRAALTSSGEAAPVDGPTVHVNDGSAHDRAMAWSEGHTAGYDEAEAALRDMLLAIPATGLVEGANRYDTDDKHVLHVWRDGVSWDIEVAREEADDGR